jgi:hypothetical protein
MFISMLLPVQERRSSPLSSS